MMDMLHVYSLMRNEHDVDYDGEIGWGLFNTVALSMSPCTLWLIMELCALAPLFIRLP